MVLQLASAKNLKKKRLVRDTKKRLGLPYVAHQNHRFYENRNSAASIFLHKAK
jgi:hypothetical protein